MKAKRTDIPRVDGELRSHAIQLPEAIWEARGIVVLGRRIKSVVFSTDIAIIRNCNADAVMAVYPFTPQQVISNAIISASSKPVFVGVGGGTTKGMRSMHIAQDAEAQGAFGVIVNSPMSNANIRLIKSVLDIPIISTIVDEEEDIRMRLDAGVSILNVAAGKLTPDVVRRIREKYPDVPIIASGGKNEESIRKTIEAGANTISYTPPSSAEIFSDLMDVYRTDKTKNQDFILDALTERRDDIVEFLKLLKNIQK